MIMKRFFDNDVIHWSPLEVLAIHHLEDPRDIVEPTQKNTVVQLSLTRPLEKLLLRHAEVPRIRDFGVEPI
jgi:hypothetical protein